MRFALIATIPLGNGERIAVVVSGDDAEGCDPLEDDLPAHLLATLEDLLARLGRRDPSGACRTRLLDASAGEGDACALEILAGRDLSAILGGRDCCGACHWAAFRREG